MALEQEKLNLCPSLSLALSLVSLPSILLLSPAKPAYRTVCDEPADELCKRVVLSLYGVDFFYHIASPRRRRLNSDFDHFASRLRCRRRLERQRRQRRRGPRQGQWRQR